VPTAKTDATRSSALTSRIKLLKLGILSISTAPTDHAALRQILKDSRWRIAQARTCKEAIARLRRKPMPVVICDSALPDGTWRHVLGQINSLAHPPVLIVTSRLADERLWAEVLNLGGYNVLAKPFRESEVQHVVSTVWMREHGQMQQVATASGA